MKMLFSVLLCFVFVFCSTTARAEFYDGQQLLNGLEAFFKPHTQRSQEDLVNASMAMGYVEGVCDAVEMDTGRPPHQPGVVPGVLAGGVRTYLRNNRDVLNKPAAPLVVDALRTKYGR